MAAGLTRTLTFTRTLTTYAPTSPNVSCPAQARHPVNTALSAEFAVRAPTLGPWVLGRPLARAMTSRFGDSVKIFSPAAKIIVDILITIDMLPTTPPVRAFLETILKRG